MVKKYVVMYAFPTAELQYHSIYTREELNEFYKQSKPENTEYVVFLLNKYTVNQLKWAISHFQERRMIVWEGKRMFLTKDQLKTKLGMDNEDANDTWDQMLAEQIIREFKRHDVLDDRLEYSEDDLQSAFPELTKREVAVLYEVLHRDDFQ